MRALELRRGSYWSTNGSRCVKRDDNGVEDEKCIYPLNDCALILSSLINCLYRVTVVMT